MPPRGFDRYMLAVEIGSSLKVARLTDREFRCLVCGVWPVAAKATPRGYLAVGGQPATAADVAHQARVPVAAARKALEHLRALGMLEMVPDVGLEYCHDWHDLNPDPAGDKTAAERQRKRRDKQRRHGGVTRDGHADVTQSVTDVTVPEVEGEEEESETTSLTNGRKRAESRKADQAALPLSLPGELHHAAHLALTILQGVQSERGGNEPTIRGVGLAVQRFPNRDHAGVARQLEHWALAGTGQAKPVADWARTFATFLERSPAGKPVQVGQVVPLRSGRQSPSDLLRSMAETEAAERVPDAEVVDDEEAS